MGGRGSGGGRGGRASAGGGGGSAMNKEELINLYNNISKSSAYTVEQQVSAMESIRREIEKIDAKKQVKIPKGKPYLKNIYDGNEVDALKSKTLKSIDKLQKKYNWYGDTTLNKIQSRLQKTSIFEGEDVLALADDFYKYKSKYVKKVKSF